MRPISLALVMSRQVRGTVAPGTTPAEGARSAPRVYHARGKRRHQRDRHGPRPAVYRRTDRCVAGTERRPLTNPPGLASVNSPLETTVSPSTNVSM